MITPEDHQLLRRAIAIAADALTTNDAPYGSLLADDGGRVIIVAHNTVRRDNDITAHPELKLARWAAAELKPGAAARTTMYTSCQPCGMCTGAIVRSGLGRVVYVLSSAGRHWDYLATDGARYSGLSATLRTTWRVSPTR